MAYLCTTQAEIDQKVGAGVGAGWTTAMAEAAEIRHLATMSTISRYNWVDNMPTNADVKGILSDIVASLIAAEGISYDMSGYTSRIEAEDMVTIQRDIALRGLSLIRDQKVVTFIIANAT